MNKSQEATTRCFSGVLRRLLCTGSLPTHPSDHITEGNTVEFDHPKKDLKSGEAYKVEVQATPGIVARLMGLESVPDLTWVPKGRALDSVARSRSVNFMDYLPEFDQTEGQHRRVRTSVSFREVPTFLQYQQNQDFFVLCLENVDETKETGSKLRKSETGSGALKPKKAEKIRTKENIRDRVLVKKEENQENNKKVCKGKDEPKRVSSKHSSKVGNCHEANKGSGLAMPQKKDVYRTPRATSKAKKPLEPTNHNMDVSAGTKLTKKEKSTQQAVKIVEPECNSENSSPVSVLDVNDFSSHLEAPSSEDSSLMGLNSRRKSPPRIANCDYPSPNLVRISITDDEEGSTIKNKDNELMKTRETGYYIKLADEIYRLTEEDIKAASDWLAKEVFKFEDFEEICMEFGQQILDQLLHQVVDELGWI